jgi:hypothetical protein
MRSSAAFLTFSILVSGIRIAAQPVAEEKILLPVVIEEPVPGAYGSLWVTEIALVNTSANLVFVYGVETGCGLPICPGENAVGPKSTLYPHALGIDRSVNAHLLKVTDDPEAVSVQITVQDQSRALDTWGTSVPAVRERQAWSSAFQLLDVPGPSTRFRSLLRLYSFDSSHATSARVRFYRTQPTHEFPYEPNEADVLLAERVVELRASSSEFTPGYAELGLWNVPEIPDNSRLRLEIVPETAGARLWGMVSVTNNDTQHVTVITPMAK